MQLVGTFIAVVSGWIVGVISLAVIAAAGIGGAQRDAALEGALVTGIYMWIFILPVWLFALVPLYLLVPRSSWLWRPVICTGFGAVGGFVSAAVWTHANFHSYMASFYAVAIIVGAATCLTGVVTRDRFKA